MKSPGQRVAWPRGATIGHRCYMSPSAARTFAEALEVGRAAFGPEFIIRQGEP